jgi:DNA-binding NarL/FixJ family response regulator
MAHKTWLVDDHQLFRAGFKTLLNRTGTVTVEHELSNGAEFLELLLSNRPDLVFLDISMPGMDGSEVAMKALSMYPDLRIIVLSMYGDYEYYARMCKLGVKGYLLKSADFKEVEIAIDAVTGGNTYFSQELMQLVVKHHNDTDTTVCGAEISDREKEVLVEICNGLSSQEIADKLFISKRTVEKHRANLMEKTGCANTASLVMFAVKNRLFEL